MAITSLNQQNPQPFTVQDPDALLKTYGYDMQAIANAARNGIVDPTAAVLAGMKYKYMQTATQGQGQKPQTVAQEVLAPPAPQGLGGLPQGAMPQQAMAGMPQAMPQGMLPAAPPMPPAQGMAGPEAMMAEGGLAGLEVPDDMFMESDNYGGGGMVAFAQAGEVDYGSMSDNDLLKLRQPEYMSLEDAQAQTQGLLGPYGGENLAAYKAALAERMGAGQEKKDKDQALGEFLMNLGFGAAGQNQPGGFIANLAAAAAPAGTAALKSAKETKKERQAALKDSVDLELAEYGVKAKNLETAMAIQKRADELESKGLDRESAMQRAALDHRMGLKQLAVQREVGLKATADENRVRRLAADYRRQNPNLSEGEALAMAEREAAVLSNPYVSSKIGLQVETAIQNELEAWDKRFGSLLDNYTMLEASKKLTAVDKKEFEKLKAQRTAVEAQARKKYENFLGNVNSIVPAANLTLPELTPEQTERLGRLDPDQR